MLKIMIGEILDISNYEDKYRIIVEFKNKPPFKLGEVKIKQNIGEEDGK